MSQSNVTSRKFGQRREPLTTRLHGLVRSYPKGVGILQEFVQNADDAGATEVWVVLDERQHPSTKLPSHAMAALQGPALVIANDAEFTELDLDRIQQIGESGKALDASKTGRFGFGFNAVYNVTDWPGLLARDQLGFFDPHAETVHEATTEDPGTAWPLNSAVWHEFHDLLAPFDIVGLAPGDEFFETTAFRLPLRTTEHAERSKICQQAFTRDDFLRIVEKLEPQIGDLLLFLRHVTSIRISAVDAQGRRTELVQATTKNLDEVEAARTPIRESLACDHHELLNRLSKDDAPVVGEWTHDIEVRARGEARTEHWRVVHGLFLDGEDELLGVARRLLEYGEKAVPLAGAAARVGAGNSDGRLYCTLPLPESSFMPFHIHGFLDLQSDRQGVFADSGAEGKDAVRVEWNRRLLEHACAEAAARLLVLIGKSEETSQYEHWPRIQPNPGSLLQELPTHVYARLAAHECLVAGMDGHWCRPQEVRLVSASRKQVREALLSGGLPIPNPSLPSQVEEGFDAGRAPLHKLTPAEVREHLRVEDDGPWMIEKAPHAAVRNSAWILPLLRFCVGDDDLDDLAGVPLARMADGSLRAFGLDEECPIYLASKQTRTLFAECSDWFIDAEIEEEDILAASTGAGIETMAPQDAVRKLQSVVTTVEDDGQRAWDPDEEGVPTEEWLVLLYTYLAEHADDISLRSGDLDKLPLVPDQFGRLWAPGDANTPLLPAGTREQEQLVNALRPFRVPLVDGGAELVAAIRAAEKAFPDQLLWKITGRDLIDTLHAVRHDWEDAASTYSRDHHGRILDFLSGKSVVSGLRNEYADRAERLRGFSIFPTGSRDLVSLEDDDVFLPADYRLPSVTAIAWLQTGPQDRWAQLYSVLDVPTLTRARVVRDYLLPTYGDLSPIEQNHALHWIRAELERALDELEDRSDDEADQLRRLVRTTRLIRCTDGELRAAERIYHPEEAVVAELLGQTVGFPDMKHYSPHAGRWLAFFEQCGMVRTPRPGDILRAVDHLVDSASTDASKAVLDRIERLVKYLGERWADLRDEVVEDPNRNNADKDELTLGDALTIRAWLPAMREAPRGFPASLFEPPEDRLHKPEELYSRGAFDLISSTRPVLAFEGPAPALRDDLGIATRPALEDVVRQFESLLELCKQEELPEQQRNRVRGLLTRVYRHFGEYRLGSEDEDDEGVTDSLRAFAERPCIVDANGRLWRPAHVFAEPVPYFLGQRAHIQARNLDHERGMDALGRRRAPSCGDFEEFFKELAAAQADLPVAESLLADLRAAYHKAVVTLPPDARFEATPVLAEDRCLCDPEFVMVDDAPWLSARVGRTTLRCLDRQLPTEVARAFGVQALSHAVYESVLRTETGETGTFAAQCEELERLLRTPEFMTGVQRLMKHCGHQPRGTDLGWLSDVRVSPVRLLETILMSHDRAEPISDSEGQSDVLYDPDTNSLIVSVDARDVLTERVAEVLNQQFEFDGMGLDDCLGLSAILRTQPGQIDELLTRLRIRKTEEVLELPEEPEPEASVYVDDDDAVDDDPEQDLESAEDLTETQERVAPSHQAVPSGAEGTGGQPGRGSGQGKRAPRGDENDEPTPEPSGRSSDVDEAPAGPGVRKPTPGRSRSAGAQGRSKRAVTYVSGNVESSTDTGSSGADRRSQVDKAAVRLVLEFEREHGRDPKAMPHNNPGYDVESRDADGKPVRFIEVKGLSGPWSEWGVSLSSTQHGYGQRRGAQFWLYVVEFAREADRARLYAIQDPTTLIDQYFFDSGWKHLSKERGGTGATAEPVVGNRILIGGTKSGTIKKVHKRGALKRVWVRYEDGTVEPLVFNPARMTVLPGEEPQT